ncbi:hypothetical protein BRC83_09000 [Halobacteriales archaeon QS_1_68_17]|nr:MAG: hypothetical protein BRC83_09000 [Halobacteriales archaeon QS_1_68_17]
MSTTAAAVFGTALLVALLAVLGAAGFVGCRRGGERDDAPAAGDPGDGPGPDRPGVVCRDCGTENDVAAVYCRHCETTVAPAAWPAAASLGAA